MALIKRYPNRKLYDTDRKRYITLDEIADLIRQGDEVRVIDNATGEDLTALTLTQVILEQEKKPGGFLPGALLSGLIRAGGNRIQALQRSLAASLGLWHLVNEEIRRRIQDLIALGELEEAEGQRLLQKLLDRDHIPQDDHLVPVTREAILEQIERHLASRQIPSREDLQQLAAQIDALTAELEKLNPPDA
ncbi:MAG: pesticidal protein Cry15Aa [Chloroflexi bacterium]|jgi:polyhydroxyalkanoate synthesis repressor PhaR|nr:pesticidal protein Cry15Aa [Chloroflexota bacterium]